MTQNVEIEFKTIIPLETYQYLLKHFELENNIFKQVNYYFDTDDYTLNQKQIVLRIRQKGDRYKVTLKCQSDKQAYEKHFVLQPEKAKDMIANGFQTKAFFDDIDAFVTFRVSLDNYRVSTPYEGGTLFLDRCDYCNVTDYELEYEANNYEEGKVIFEKLLSRCNIEPIPIKRKSERAFTCRR